MDGIIKSIEKIIVEREEEYRKISHRMEVLQYKLANLQRAIRCLKNLEKTDVIEHDLDFEETIDHMLRNEGYPLTSGQLFDVYKSLYPDEPKTRGSFSGQITHLFNTSDSLIRLNFPKLKGRSKYLYALPSWFDENEQLRIEFQNRMKQCNPLIPS